MRPQENVLAAVTLHPASQLPVFLSVHLANLFKWMLLATSSGAATCVLVWLTSTRVEYNSRQKGGNPVHHAPPPATGHNSLASEQTAALLTSSPTYTLSTLKLHIYQLHQQWINNCNAQCFLSYSYKTNSCFESCTFWNVSPHTISATDKTDASDMSIHVQGSVYLSIIS